MRRALVSMLVLLLLGSMIGLGALSPAMTPESSAQELTCEGQEVTPTPVEGTPAASPVPSPAATPAATELSGLIRVVSPGVKFDLKELFPSGAVGDDFSQAVGVFCLEGGGTMPETEYTEAILIQVLDGELDIKLVSALDADILRITGTGTSGDIGPGDHTIKTGEAVRFIGGTFEIKNGFSTVGTLFVVATIGVEDGGCVRNCFLP